MSSRDSASDCNELDVLNCRDLGSVLHIFSVQGFFVFSFVSSIDALDEVWASTLDVATAVSISWLTTSRDCKSARRRLFFSATSLAEAWIFSDAFTLMLSYFRSLLFNFCKYSFLRALDFRWLFLIRLRLFGFCGSDFKVSSLFKIRTRFNSTVDDIVV